jgi:hypothetical protein
MMMQPVNPQLSWTAAAPAAAEKWHRHANSTAWAMQHTGIIPGWGRFRHPGQAGGRETEPCIQCHKAMQAKATPNLVFCKQLEVPRMIRASMPVAALVMCAGQAKITSCCKDDSFSSKHWPLQAVVRALSRRGLPPHCTPIAHAIRDRKQLSLSPHLGAEPKSRGPVRAVKGGPLRCDGWSPFLPGLSPLLLL